MSNPVTSFTELTKERMGIESRLQEILDNTKCICGASIIEHHFSRCADKLEPKREIYVEYINLSMRLVHLIHKTYQVIGAL